MPNPVLAIFIALYPFAFARMLMTYGAYLTRLSLLPRYFIATMLIVLALSVAGLVCAYVLRRRAHAGKVKADDVATIYMVVRVLDCPPFVVVLVTLVGLGVDRVLSVLAIGMGVVFLVFEMLTWRQLSDAVTFRADAEGYYSIAEEGSHFPKCLIPGVGLFDSVKLCRLLLDRIEGKDHPLREKPAIDGKTDKGKLPAKASDSSTGAKAKTSKSKPSKSKKKGGE